MSGSPNETELQTQWQNTVDILETTRAFSDDTAAVADGLLGVLEQSLDGEYTPDGLANFAANFRAGLSSLAEPSRALEAITPILFEYGRLIGFGGAYQDTQSLMRALYDHFVDNSLSVQSRTITYDTSQTDGAGNVGNGVMARLSTDSEGFDLEDCNVETKIFRCRQDQNTGANENAEVFECLGEAASRDALLRSAHGSGELGRSFITAKHAGTGSGGSLLRNSSFSTFTDGATQEFSGWTASGAGAANISQSSTYYRTYPNASSDKSLEMDGSSGAAITLKQTLSDMRISSLDAETPYFLRVMFNRQSSCDGTLTIKMGSASTATVLSAQSGWTEALIAVGQNCWPRQFNEDPFDVEISLTGGSTGTLLVDDVIFAPFDLIDGTYWLMRGNQASHTPSLLDDTMTFTDEGGAPATGKIQWWLNVAGLGYLPSSELSPTLSDPA